MNIFNLEFASNSVEGKDVNKFKDWVRLNKLIRVNESRDILTDDYLNTHIINERIPVTEIKLTAHNKSYSIFVIGKNNIICYDELPNFYNRILGIFKI